MFPKESLMKRYFAIFSLLCTFSTLALAESVKLGDTAVTIARWGQGQPVYVHVHMNEDTSLQAAKAMIKRKGGTIISIRHKGGRLLAFRMGKTQYRVDPNRIFTPRGRRMTLAQYSHYNEAAEQAVAKFANTLVKHLPPGKIIALHNNSPRYTLADYMQGGRFQRDAAQVNYNPEHSKRTFFYVTQKKTYQYLAKKGFNVILQDNRNVQDDGSLSVFAANAGRTYVNVEAGHGMLSAQIKMLEALYAMP
jgi:ribosomal protein S6